MNYFNILPRNLVQKISVYLDIRSLISLLRTNKRVNNYINNEIFWMNKCLRDFNLNIVLDKIKSWKELYYKGSVTNVDQLLADACTTGILVLAKIAISRGANINNLYIINYIHYSSPCTIASRYGHLDILKYLVEVGANIHIKDDYALRKASRYGHLEVVKYLVSLGANIHAQNEGALAQASEKGHLEIVKYLVSLDADIHAHSEWALKVASRHGHLEVIKYLVENGADIHVQDDWILGISSSNGHLEVIKYLVSLGADIHAKNDRAILMANAWGSLEVVNYLESLL